MPGETCPLKYSLGIRVAMPSPNYYVSFNLNLVLSFLRPFKPSHSPGQPRPQCKDLVITILFFHDCRCCPSRPLEISCLLRPLLPKVLIRWVIHIEVDFMIVLQDVLVLVLNIGLKVLCPFCRPECWSCLNRTISKRNITKTFSGSEKVRYWLLVTQPYSSNGSSFHCTLNYH